MLPRILQRAIHKVFNHRAMTAQRHRELKNQHEQLKTKREELYQFLLKNSDKFALAHRIRADIKEIDLQMVDIYEEILTSKSQPA